MTVDPGQRLSYQKHARRAEHWVVVGDARWSPSTAIRTSSAWATRSTSPWAPRTASRTRATTELVFIEVQTGDYFGEDDIVRLDDDYGRTADDG